MVTEYDDIYESYKAYERTRFKPDPRREIVWQEIIRYLEKRFGVPETMLEIGAGFCAAINTSSALHRFATDIRPEFAQYAKSGIHTRVGSCTDLAWLTGHKCDWVLASNLFEHLPRTTLHLTLQAMRSVMKTEGLLIIIGPNFKFAYKTYFDDYTHLPESIFTETSLCDYLAAEGFAVEACEPRFLPFSLKQRIPVSPWLVRFYLHSFWKPKAGQMLVVARCLS